MIRVTSTPLLPIRFFLVLQSPLIIDGEGQLLKKNGGSARGSLMKTSGEIIVLLISIPDTTVHCVRKH